MEFSTKPSWWETDVYDIDTPELRIPQKPACVQVYAMDKTQPGWGLVGPKDKVTGEPTEGFITRFARGEFDHRTAFWRYRKKQAPFAYVMRSVPLVCIDVDGKNGGFESMPLLGELPPTLTETSKSGTGLHLFYRTGEQWDDELGYARFDDQIGLVTGIDVRATGCVYHYPTQRWNNREPAPVPDFLASKLERKKARREAAKVAAKMIPEMDEVDRMVAQHELVTELEKPIAPGKRNTTLFAIGSQMFEAEVEDWEGLISARALAIGLDQAEAEKLVSNIATYASK